MKKKAGIYGLLGALAYALLLLALVAAERTAPDASIRTLGDAAWFSLVTLTTVGYGDLSPVSSLGRVIGLVFVLLSVGVLAAVFGAAVSFLRGWLLPRLRLGRLGRQRCFFFSGINEASAALAADLLKRDAKARVVFCGAERPEIPLSLPAGRRVSFFRQDVAEALRAAAKNGGGHAVFLLGENAAENCAKAEAMRELSDEIYCRGPETAGLPGVRFVDDAECAARAYWQAHPLEDGEETLLLIGDGPLAWALLDQAVLVNCRYPFRAAAYHLFGGWEEYRRFHPALTEALAPEAKEKGRDALIFHRDPWNADPDLLEKADRIIFCGADQEKNAEDAGRLIRYFPLSGRVYAASAAAAPPAVGFGSPREVFTEEIVIRSALDARARALHASYCRRTGCAQPWEALSPFLKASNRAAADHLMTKARLLVPGTPAESGADALFGEACAKWRQAPDKEPFRRNENERWRRFSLLYNWKWGPEKSEIRRTHPLLVPFDELSEADREKDDAAWLQLGDVRAYDGQKEETP